LARGTSEEFWYVWRRRSWLVPDGGYLMMDLRGKDLRETTILLVDANVHTAIVGDNGIGAHVRAVLGQLPRYLGVCRRRVVGVFIVGGCGIQVMICALPVQSISMRICLKEA
jgi:hypothetical protein